MKLGLTTTSRSVPHPPLASRPSQAEDPARPLHEPPLVLRVAKAPAEHTSAATDVQSASAPSANDEPPPQGKSGKSGKPGKNDKSAPRSAVRRKAADLTSRPSMRGSVPSPRTTSARGRDAKVPASAPNASSPKKKERNAAETKRRILEAAAAEFAAKGFDGARLGTIARSADVQQALIHHYFVDKEGLHTEVLRGGLAAMTEDAWNLLAQMDAPIANRKGKKRRGPAELEALAEAFVDLLLRFFATNGAFLSILRHEARRDAGGQAATKIVADNVAPIFDAIVARVDEMRARGEVRKDVDAKHLALSCVAMIAFPFQEEPFVASIWPVDWRRPDHLAERKRHVVEMILARVLP